MITLNEIAYNIKNLAYGGSTSTENSISLRQIKHWIHYHRAKLIADNIDKGITNNQALYQNISLTAKNSTSKSVIEYYKDWDQYKLDGATAPSAAGDNFLENMPKNSNGLLNGEWLAISSISTGEASSNGKNRNFYGEEVMSSQVRGDWRNFGAHSFYCPKPVQLKNDEGIKSVSITREVYFPDDPLTNDTDESDEGLNRKLIKIYRKEHNMFDEYNKFTDYSEPYYYQDQSRKNNENYISFQSLQISPNYHGGLNTPGNKKLFWKYRASASMILENPTEIDMMGDWEDTKLNWDDDTTPYPIPMEYVSDLIQRVIQVEMQTELKTTPDIVTDGLDDIIKQKISGPQVQR